MGVCNSSEHRVFPVFNALRARDKTGLSWLSTVLALPEREGRERLSLTPDEIGALEFAAWTVPSAKGSPPPAREPGWQPTEKRLRAPPALLHELIDRVTQPHSPGQWGDGDTEKYRRDLSHKDPATIEEAHRLLDGPSRRRRWEVLEGPSCPDVFLRTAKIVVVIEGKFTERAPTTYTTWLAGRHQMLRHLDAAWEDRGTRDIYGFFIVEYPKREGWINASDATIDSETLKTSLPHRDPQSRAAIANSFLGVTNWESVCLATGLPLTLLKSEAELRGKSRP